MTLLEWLQDQSYQANSVALLERGRKSWDIWELLYFIKKCVAIPNFPLGQHFKNTHVYQEGHWLISEETGSLLYEVVVAGPKPIVSITGRVIQNARRG